MNKPAKSEAAPTRPSLTTWIMLAVLLWGALLALGSYLFGGNHAVQRAVIVFGVTVAFLLMWVGALAMRKRRLEREQAVEREA
jgi:membrane protein DedA with SNARE-associated domain